MFYQRWLQMRSVNEMRLYRNRNDNQVRIWITKIALNLQNLENKRLVTIKNFQTIFINLNQRLLLNPGKKTYYNFQMISSLLNLVLLAGANPTWQSFDKLANSELGHMTKVVRNSNLTHQNSNRFLFLVRPKWGRNQF